MHDRRIATLGLGVIAVALVMTGCSSSSHSASSAPKTAPQVTTTTLAVPVSANGVPPVIPGTATGNSACEKALPTPASPGQVGAGSGGGADTSSPAAVESSEHGARGMVVQKSLTHTQRDELEAQMSAARTVANKYPTVKDAEAAGYFRSTTYVPCIGAHYTNFALVGHFDPAAPSELLYDGTTPDSKIVGLSYLVRNEPGAPSGFAGPNDHWHQHNANGGLCISHQGVIGSEALTRKECAARGGRKTLLQNIWMVHAWVVPGFECTWGTFSGECPELGGRLCGNAWESPLPPSKPDTCPTGKSS